MRATARSTKISYRWALSSCQAAPSGIFLPTSIGISLSKDGKNFALPTAATHDVPEPQKEAKVTLRARIGGQEAQHLRVRAIGLGKIPEWHHAGGRKAWLFVDEILVNPER
jgi:hypothetical protein